MGKRETEKEIDIYHQQLAEVEEVKVESTVEASCWDRSGYPTFCHQCPAKIHHYQNLNHRPSLDQSTKNKCKIKRK
jgi:hypothetical protein